jgi:glycosyltransferase involved in cell wall biosynthesis
MPPTVLLDLTHTSHTNARTGVQRVVRSLGTALGDRARPVCYDPYLGDWRDLEGWELANLAAEAPAANRGARWPLRARLRSWIRRFGAGFSSSKPGQGGLDAAQLGNDALLAPELFSRKTAGALGRLRSRVRGPRVAIFYDAIALRLPELTPSRTVARFPSYLQELLAFDGIAAISEDSRQSLLDYWRWLGIGSAPPVAAITLGVDPPMESSEPGENGLAASKRSEDTRTLLCVSTIEGRKNHLALLDACERLWTRGVRFEMRLIGLAQPQTGREALEKIASLQRAGRPLRYDGPVDDATLASAYRQCAFTVYPSLLEGFGLPVIESLARGRPCVCSGQGALGEAARGGGCLTLPRVDAGNLAGAMESLFADSAALSRLSAEALSRRFKTWAEYARELGDWIPTLSRR